MWQKGGFGMGKFLDKYFWTVAKLSLIAWVGWEMIVFFWMMIIPMLSFFHAIIRFFLWATVLLVIAAVVFGLPVFLWRILYEMKQSLDTATAVATADGVATHGGAGSRRHGESERDRDDRHREPRRAPLLTEYDPDRPSRHRPRTPFGDDES
jgi:hypothetical protein